MLLKELALS